MHKKTHKILVIGYYRPRPRVLDTPEPNNLAFWNNLPATESEDCH